MALRPIPLAPSSSSSSCCVSSTLSRSSPSQHFLLFQPKSHATLKFGVCCSNQTPQLDTERAKVTLEAAKKKKKKNSSRPSFFDQIRGKWSLKLGSQREKFPWQLPEQEEQEEEGTEEEEEDKEEEEEETLNFRFPKHLSPWPQAENPTNPQLASESEDNGEPLQQSLVGSVIERERVLEEVSNESASSREESNVERKRRRSNAALAERLIPEHELRRLRNVALRTVERFEVGVAGVTQELVDSIHHKWRDNEVVKLKFETPLSANMKRAHHILEVTLHTFFP